VLRWPRVRGCGSNGAIRAEAYVDRDGTIAGVRSPHRAMGRRAARMAPISTTILRVDCWASIREMKRCSAISTIE
jgi:hypothetical protein